MAVKKKTRVRAAPTLKNQLVDLARGNIGEPEVKGEPLSKMDMVHALNYYALNHECAQKKEWSITWAEANAPELVTRIRACDSGFFNTYAALARMMSRGQFISCEHEAAMRDFFATLPVPDDYDQVKEPKQRAPRANPIFDAFEDALDAALIDYTPPGFDLTLPGSIQAIKDYCNNEIADIRAYPEAYPERALEWLQKCLTYVSKAKPRKKVKRKRKVDPAKVVSKMQFCERDDATGLESIQPVDILGKTKVYLYNTKYRKLFVYYAESDAGFEVKGSTVLNVDMGKSKVKTIRKPERVLRAGTMGVRDIERAFKMVTTAEKPVTATQVRQFVVIVAAS